MNEQKSKNKIKLNFIWQLGIEITNMMLPLITSPILSRRLGLNPLDYIPMYIVFHIIL